LGKGEEKMRFMIWICLIIFSYAQPLQLSQEERELVQSHHLKCISTGLWAPFNLIEHGKLAGIGLDYWKLIEDRLGLKSEYIIAEKWTDVLDAIKTRKADLTIATQETKERIAYAVFSKPYARYPLVIATKNSVGFIYDIKLIKDKKIVMPKYYATTDMLLRHYPELNIIYVASIDRALEMVENDEAFATLDILPVIAYKINKDGYDTLKISGSIPEYFKAEIMLRKDYAALIPLINRAIDSITPEEKQHINEHWIKLHHEDRVSKKYFFVLLGWSFAVILFFIIWLLYLRREIYRKRNTEKKLKKLVAIDSLTQVYNRYMLNRILDKEVALAHRYSLPLSIILFDIDGFKKINETYGFKTGDTVLQELSQIIQNRIRKSDVFGRWENDAFLIILPNTTEENASILVEYLQQTIEEYHFTKDIKLHCSFEITACQDEDTRIEMIYRVDKYFYEEQQNPVY
jgi:polar amino acid transport system substrate-binding protein